MNYIEIIDELNNELYEKFGDTEYFCFSFETNGSVEIIKFEDHILWCSEDDNRIFDENINDYEPFIPFIKREFNKYVDRLNMMKFNTLMTKEQQIENYGIYVGAKVCLTMEQSMVGIVKHIDENLKDVTTCNVCWIEQNGISFPDSDDKEDWDIQWNNKLYLIN